MRKTTKVNFGHYIEHFSERNSKITGDNARSGGERGGNKVTEIGMAWVFRVVAQGNQRSGGIGTQVVHVDERRFGQNCVLDQCTRLLCQSARRMNSAFGGRFFGLGHAAAKNHKQTTKRSEEKKNTIYQEDEIHWYHRICTMNCVIGFDRRS
jgi:hypothetical protein